MEIDPAKYTPEEVKHELVTEMPPIRINVDEMMKANAKKANECRVLFSICLG